MTPKLLEPRSSVLPPSPRPDRRGRSPLAPAGGIAIIGAMIGVAIGLLVALTIGGTEPRAGAPTVVDEREVAAAEPAAGVLAWDMAPDWPTYPEAMSVNVEGGELVVVIATAIPTELPTATPGVVPTSTPLLPLCTAAKPGQTCEWPVPTVTPSPIALCDTPMPGSRCTWPTPTG